MGREPADDELIERARDGDTAAYGELVRRYEQVAFRTAYAVCGDAAEAEDAAQEAFVKAYAALPRFRRGRAVAAVAAAHRRERGAQPPPRRGPAGAPGGAGGARRARRAVPAARRASRDGPLLAALARLDAPHREIVVLRHLLDLSEAECAEVLGCRQGHREVASLACARAAAGRRWRRADA